MADLEPAQVWNRLVRLLGRYAAGTDPHNTLALRTLAHEVMQLAKAGNPYERIAALEAAVAERDAQIAEYEAIQSRRGVPSSSEVQRARGEAKRGNTTG